MSILKMYVSTYEFFDNESMGICVKCAYAQDCVEPDAREYVCETCETPTVFGTPELLLSGDLILIEPPEKETVNW